MQAVIIAGGKGTRLKGLNGDLPKPLVDIGGKPLLEHQILLAKANGILDILLLTGFGADSIQDFCQDGSKWGVSIHYHRESQPLGTAGAVLDAYPQLKQDFVVLYADTMLNVDLGRMHSFHRHSAGITLFLHPNDHPQDSDLIEIDETSRVTGLHPYPHPPGKFLRNLVNAGLYAVHKDCLEPWYQRRASLAYPFDFGKHLFPQMIASAGDLLRGYVSREYIKDAGTPQRVYRVREDLLSGRIRAARWDCPKPAVFFCGKSALRVDSSQEVELYPGAAQAVRSVNEQGRLAVLVINQTSESQLTVIRNQFETRIGAEGAFVDAVCSCQDHSHAIKQAAADLNIDLEQSWMIGGSLEDVEAAGRCGISSILIHTDSQDRERLSHPPDFVCEDVRSAVRLIAEKERTAQ